MWHTFMYFSSFPFLSLVPLCGVGSSCLPTPFISIPRSRRVYILDSNIRSHEKLPLGKNLDDPLVKTRKNIISIEQVSVEQEG